MAKSHFLLCIIGLIVVLVWFLQLGAASHHTIFQTIFVMLTFLVPGGAVILMNIDERRLHRRALERLRQRDIKQKYR